MKKIGNWIGVLLFVSLLFAGLAPLTSPSAAFASGTIRHASPTGVNTGSCTTWATACNLQRALATVSVSGDQLWVKQGTYKPGSSRTNTFTLKNGVKIYGGFTGTETLLNQRNPATHVTILSGDIGTPAYSADNSYHVLYSAGVNSTAVLDGFTITAGNANGTDPLHCGGGMYNEAASSPTLSNLIFSGNAAPGPGLGLGCGGGMQNRDFSSPILTNVTFNGNTSIGSSGGGMYNYNGSNPVLQDVTFSGNTAFDGGGLYNNISSPTLTNVSFISNGTGGVSRYGGGMYNDNSNPVLTNVSFIGNSSEYGGGMQNTGGNPILTNVTFTANGVGHYGGGMYNVASSPVLKNVTFQGNSAPWGGGMLNDNSSPILTNVTFSANTGCCGLYNDNGSSPSIYDSIFWNNGTEIWNLTTSYPTVADSLIAGGCPSGATCTGTLLSVDPLLGPLANNGGFTKTMALKAGSPAINNANNSTCASKDQRGVHRPLGPHCDMGAYEAIYKLFISNGSQDGWILESGENTNTGGTLNSTGTTLILGDDASRKQARSVLSFNTSSLPDNAVISSANLKFFRSSVTPPASDPISLLHGFMLDVKKGYFGSASSLQAGDFQAPANKTVGPFSPAPIVDEYDISLPSSSFASINKLAANGGLTQIRLRFKLDDNNDFIADTFNFFSGNHSITGFRPSLMIVYNTP